MANGFWWYVQRSGYQRGCAMSELPPGGACGDVSAGRAHRAAHKIKGHASPWPRMAWLAIAANWGQYLRQLARVKAPPLGSYLAVTASCCCREKVSLSSQ